jgi:hypothetical protein
MRAGSLLSLFFQEQNERSRLRGRIAPWGTGRRGIEAVSRLRTMKVLDIDQITMLQACYYIVLFVHTGNALGKAVRDRRCPAAVTVDEIRKRATGTIVPGRRGE